MAYEKRKIFELVNDAENGAIETPEFQRAFVWDAKRVAEFVDSIYKEYPIGMLIFWKRPNENVNYVVDGLQRITSMCLIFDKTPKWYRRDAKNKNLWKEIKKKCNIGVYLENSSFMFDQITARNIDKLCPITKILGDYSLTKLAEEYSFKWNIDKDKLTELFFDLKTKIKNYEVQCYIIPEHFSDFAHVTEIFERINRGGVEVKISDVIITRLVGFAWSGFKDDFDKFINCLIEEGYITEAEKYKSGILQIFSAIAEPKDPRLESILRKKPSEIKETWGKTKTIIREVFRDVRERFGITPKDLGDLKPFIILCRLYHKFGVDFKDRLPFVFRWFILRVTRAYGGYGPAMSDLERIERSEYLSSAVEELCRGLSSPSVEEIVGNSFRSRLSTLLKILCFKTNARDFVERDLKVTDNNMEKHHFFPKKLLRRYTTEKADLLPNCVIISSTTNKKIGDKEPYQYLQELKVSDDDLKRHLLPLDRDLFKVNKYNTFLKKRAEIIVKAIENYLANLEQNIDKIDLDEIYY